MNAKFNLPDFYVGQAAYSNLVNFMRDYPECFIPYTEISAIFGNFDACIWNGGGMEIVGSVSKNEIEDVINYYNYELHLPLRFTFTNPILSQEQCFDTYANIIAECGNNGHNQILVVNHILENYLRTHYKNYKYCRSIIAARDIPYELTGPHGDYYLSVMRRRMNNNWDYLNSIPDEDRPHIEFLCNDPCPDNCPRLYTHYRDFAYCQGTLSLGTENTKCTMEKAKGTFQIHNMRENCETFISRPMIDEEYIPRGFCEFKLSGRGQILAIVDNILEYMVLPEYRSDMYFCLLNPYFD